MERLESNVKHCTASSETPGYKWVLESAPLANISFAGLLPFGCQASKWKMLKSCSSIHPHNSFPEMTNM